MSSDENKVPDIVKLYDNVIKNLEFCKPDVNRLNFNCLNQTSELKLRLTIPDDVRNNKRNLEIPASELYEISEIYDNTLTPINIKPELKDGRWIIRGKDLPKTENILLIMQGKVSDEVIQRLVRIDAPKDPIKKDETDEYWLHSAIRDVSLLENIYQELNIADIQLAVKVGIQRTFAAAAPGEVIEFFETRARIEGALASRDRENLFRQWNALRSARKKVGNLQTYQLVQEIQKLLSAEKFRVYIVINKPYRIHNVSYSGIGLPETVDVNVLTNLNKRLPAANGNLVFKKRDFSLNVTEEFHQLMDGGSKKLKKSKRT